MQTTPKMQIKRKLEDVSSNDTEDGAIKSSIIKSQNSSTGLSNSHNQTSQPPVREKYKLEDTIKELLNNNQDIAHLNVGGDFFQIKVTSLMRHPKSLLGILAFQGSFSQNKTKENALYIDRDPRLFPSILSYYRTGRIYLEKDSDRLPLRDELDYFKLSPKPSEIVEDGDIWVKIAKTVRKNVKNEVLRSILLSQAYKRDERIKFFYGIEERTKSKTSCLDAARIECPYCNTMVYFHTSDWMCSKRRHPGIWVRESGSWSCCRSNDLRLDGCTFITHYECLGFDKE